MSTIPNFPAMKPSTPGARSATTEAEKGGAEQISDHSVSDKFDAYRYGDIKLTGGMFRKLITTQLPETPEDELCHDTLPPGHLRAPQKDSVTSTTLVPPAGSEDLTPAERRAIGEKRSWLRPLWILLLLGCAGAAGVAAWPSTPASTQRLSSESAPEGNAPTSNATKSGWPRPSTDAPAPAPQAEAPAAAANRERETNDGAAESSAPAPDMNTTQIQAVLSRTGPTETIEPRLGLETSPPESPRGRPPGLDSSRTEPPQSAPGHLQKPQHPSRERPTSTPPPASSSELYFEP